MTNQEKPKFDEEHSKQREVVREEEEAMKAARLAGESVEATKVTEEEAKRIAEGKTLLKKAGELAAEKVGVEVKKAENPPATAELSSAPDEVEGHEPAKEKELTPEEQKELELADKLGRARDALAMIKEKGGIRYAIVMKRYREARDNFRNAIFERRKNESENLPAEKKESALQESAGALFEKLYVDEAQKLRTLQIEFRANEKGDRRVVSALYKVADNYRKMPLKYKLGIAVALMGGAVTIGTGSAALATLFVSATVAQRMLGGAATAIGLEALMQRAQEKHKKGETLLQKFYKKRGGTVEDVSREAMLGKLKDEFKKDIEVKAEKEAKAAMILEVMDAKGKQLDARLDNISKREKREEVRRYVLAGTMGVLVGSGLMAKAFHGVYELLKVKEIATIPPIEKGGVRLDVGARGPEGAVIDYLKTQGVPEATAGKQAHLMFLDFMKSPDVSKFMAEKGMSGNKDAYLELMKYIKKGAVEIAPDGKLRIADMEYVANAINKAMKGVGEKALGLESVGKVAPELGAQEFYRAAEDAFYANKEGEYYKNLAAYYEQTGKPQFVEQLRETSVNIGTVVDADWKFIKGLSNLSKEEYATIKDVKVGDLLKKTYWGMTDETRFPVAGERDYLELWRKIALRNSILEIASRLPDGEIQNVENMNVHEFLKEHYIEPQVEAVKAESVAEAIKSPVGAEAPLGAAEAGTVEKTAGAVHDKIIENTEAGVKGIFKYAPDGKIEKLIVSGKGDVSEASKLLQDNWREVLRGGKLTATLDRSVVESRAVNMLQYREILKTMEEIGRGDSAEAGYLRNAIKTTIELTEKKYGDVFK